MAKIQFSDGDFGVKLERLASRDNIRRILEAGSAAAIKEEQRRTEAAGHVRPGGGHLLRGISAGPIHEDLDKAWQYVYPMGENEHGQDLTVIAYVINYGYGGKRTAKTGDKFLTGKKDEMTDAVRAAMSAEAERIKNEIMR